MTQPELETLLLEREGDTLTVRLNRPKQLNAVTTQMLQDLVTVADWLRDQHDIHFVIFDHTSKLFSAGVDLGLVHGMVSDPATLRGQMRAHQRVAHDMMAKLSNLEQISFAAMGGSAYGAGVAIAMTADFRVMAEDIVINLPETNLSMFLTYGSTPLLVKTVGLARAKQMILFAEDVSAKECLDAGVAQAVVPQAEVRTTIQSMIETLRKRDWRAIRIAKQVANASVAPQFGNMILTEPELVAGSIADGEITERIGAFLDRKNKNKK